MKTLQSKRFLVRKSLINTNTIIEVTFKNGKICEVCNHDDAYRSA